MQIGEKKGLLDNDAALYSKRDDSKSAKKKFKELKTKKEKLAWLKAYALKPAICNLHCLFHSKAEGEICSECSSAGLLLRN